MSGTEADSSTIDRLRAQQVFRTELTLHLLDAILSRGRLNLE